jgi:hypothetical protein
MQALVVIECEAIVLCGNGEVDPLVVHVVAGRAFEPAEEKAVEERAHAATLT